MERAIFACLQSREICKMRWWMKWWRRLSGFWVSNSDLGFEFRTVWKNMGGEIDLDEQVVVWIRTTTRRKRWWACRFGQEQEGRGGGRKPRADHP
ncbi:hypothetical protein ACFX2A_038192 [Malus domestica]